jgi:putative flippase GtrA
MANAFVTGRGVPEILRYGLNGLAATAVHYSVLVLGFGVLKIPSAGLANLVAAVCGITVSFLGNRIFVFRDVSEGVLHQAARFAALYALIAAFHTGILAVWTDVYRLDYSVGFLIATGFQMVSSYFGNKHLVFSK